MINREGRIILRNKIRRALYCISLLKNILKFINSGGSTAERGLEAAVIENNGTCKHRIRKYEVINIISISKLLLSGRSLRLMNAPRFPSGTGQVVHQGREYDSNSMYV